MIHETLMGQPFKVRASYQALRFLAWSNGLEAFLAALALSYGVGFWLFGSHPAFAAAYPLAHQVSWVLLGTGVLGVIGVNGGWRWLRLGTSICAFMAWALLAVGAFGGGIDMQRRACAMMATLAMAELLVFVRLHLHMEDMRDAIEAAKIANNMHVREYGTPLPPTKADDEEGQGNVGSSERGP